MRIKIFVSFLLIISFSLSAKTLMWKVENGKSSMYILGSIHVAKPELYPLKPIIENAFSKSKNLVVEADVLAGSASLQVKTMQLGMYTDKTLKDVLSPLLYKKVIDKTTSLGLPAFAVNKMKPWLLGLTLTILHIKNLGYDPTSGIDLHFLKKAKKENKNILELESGEFQINLLASFGDKIDIKNLELLIKDWDKSAPLLKKMFEEWKEGKYDTLLKLTFAHQNEYPEMKTYYQKLLYDRNINMAKKLDNYLKQKEQSYFVVVGAGHLLGKKGIIEILRKKGYKLSQQ